MAAEPGAGRRPAAVVAVSLAVAVAALARWQSRHLGLIYPDGYQYLLMAKGIAAHLTPTLELGRKGAVFYPSIDAALKPLYPAFVALLSPLMGFLTAGQVVTVAAATAVVALLGALTLELTGSRIAGLAAGLAALVSPMLRYWAGFIGPDPLAEALVLACALALIRRHVVLGGALGALATAARPEWGVALAALALAALADGSAREQAGRALVSAALTLSIVIGVLRPPLAMPPGGATGLAGLLAMGVAAQLLARHAAASVRGRAAFAAGCAMAAAAIALSGDSPAWTALLSANWPLVALALCGALASSCAPRGATAPLLLATAAVPFAAYEYRNPASVRYLSELIPVLCLFGAWALTLALAVPRRRMLGILGAGAATVLLLAPVLTTPAAPASGSDYFQTMALWLRHSPSGTLISATPDAFGFLLPDRSEQMLAPGAHGLILLDAAQREYAPTTTAAGRLLRSYVPPAGFERPDGSIDSAPARLIAGTVTRG